MEFTVRKRVRKLQVFQMFYWIEIVCSSESERSGLLIGDTRQTFEPN